MKLSTEHLRRELQKIIEMDGVSLETIASLSGISPPTLYRIWNLQNPTVQLDTARRIATGTGRTFTIDGDKIFYEKIANPPEKDSRLGQELASLNEKMTGMSARERDTIISILRAINDLIEAGVDAENTGRR